MNDNQILSLNEVKDRVDAVLTEEMKRVQENFIIPNPNSYITETSHHLQRMVLEGGKRLRAYLVYLAYRTAGGQEEAKIMRIAAALELFHLFALMHDDIIDQADTRRSLATLHTFSRQWLAKNGRRGDWTHVAEGQTILWGDLLVSEAQAVFSASEFSGETLSQAQRLYNYMFSEVVVGQMLDVDFTSREDVPEEEVQQKTRVKSAMYSFVRPMQIGAVLGGAGEEWQGFYEELGVALGMAYQLQDDLFDLTLTAEEFGKPVMQDVEMNQHTLLSVLIKKTPERFPWFLDHLGKTVSDEIAKEIRRELADTGFINEIEGKISDYFSRAEPLIQGKEFASEAQWLEIIRAMRERKK